MATISIGSSLKESKYLSVTLDSIPAGTYYIIAKQSHKTGYNIKTIWQYQGTTLGYSSIGQSVTFSNTTSITYYIELSSDKLYIDVALSKSGSSVYLGPKIYKPNYPYTVSYYRNIPNASTTGDYIGAEQINTSNQVTLYTLESYTNNSITYDFLGWGTSRNSTSVTYNGGDTFQFGTEHNNLSLYGIWQAASVTYVINYESNGGLGSMADQLARGISGSVKFTPNNCKYIAPANKYFYIWNTNKNGMGDSYDPNSTTEYSISGNLTLYAIWKDYVYYTVTFNKNASDASGGDSGWTTKPLKEGEAGILDLSSITNPTRPGYTFEGWSTNSGSNNSVNVHSPVTISKDINFYAVWEINQPVKPSSLSVTKTTSSITVSWTVKASYGTTYAKLGSTSSTSQGVTSGSTYTHTFNDLSANTTYTIYVYHENGTTVSNNISTTTNIASFSWTVNDDSYIASGKAASNITAEKWNALQGKISEVSKRNGAGSKSYNSVTSGTEMIANGGSGQDYGFNNVRAKISNLSGNSGLPSTVNKGDFVKASYFIALKNAINSAISWTNINK